MKCLETRRRKGMTWRRYRTADGARWTTLEVPESVISNIGPARLSEALRRAQVKLDRANRNARMLKALAEGEKQIVVAVENGISESMLRRIVNQSKGKS